MGQCYVIELKLKIQNEEAFLLLSQDLAGDLKLRRYYTEKANTDSVDGIAHLFFWTVDSEAIFTKHEAEDFVLYSNAFNASYRWETVMQDWFIKVAPSLSRGSYLRVYPDSGHWKMYINGHGEADITYR